MSWDITEDAVIIDGLNFDSVKKVEKRDSSDPFMKSWEILRGYRGIDKNFKRRGDRLEKADMMPQGQESARSKQINPGSVIRTGYGIFDVVTPPYDPYLLAQYYETHFANHAAVDTKVANMVGLGYHWELSDTAMARVDTKETEKQRESARGKIERAKAMMNKWLDELNDDDTFIGTLEKAVTDLHSTGNGYIEIGRKSNGQIGYVGHIPAMTVRVRREHDGYCQIIGNKVVYFSNFGKQGYNPVTTDPNPNEIIHFKLYSPLNTYYGVPDIVSAGQALVGDQFAQQYNIDYFENKAVPRYIITVKGGRLSPDSERKLFDFMQNNLKGQNHRTLVVPLPPDTDQTKVEFKMEAIEAGVQEGSFGKYHDSNRNDILTAHQVPLSKIGMGDGSLAGTIASDRTFKEQVARPGQRTIEKKVNKIVTEVTDVLVFKLNELTLTDEAAQAQIHEKYLRAQVLLPNEVRDELGKAPRPGGDTPLELTARQAADSANEARGNDSRSQDREDNAADSPTTVNGRKPQGEKEST